MIKIRRGTFETNSSSVHSLSITTVETYDKWINGEVLYSDKLERILSEEESEKALLNAKIKFLAGAVLEKSGDDIGDMFSYFTLETHDTLTGELFVNSILEKLSDDDKASLNLLRELSSKDSCDIVQSLICKAYNSKYSMEELETTNDCLYLEDVFYADICSIIDFEYYVKEFFTFEKMDSLLDAIMKNTILLDGITYFNNKNYKTIQREYETPNLQHLIAFGYYGHD